MKKIISILSIIIAFALPVAAQQTVTISPSWSQAFEFANMAGQVKWTVFGISLCAAAVILYILGTKNSFFGLKSGVAINILFALLIVAGIASVFSKPASIRWNNDKVVNKAYLDHVGQKHIWDSLKNNCLIVDGPHNCYSKNDK